MKENNAIEYVSQILPAVNNLPKQKKVSNRFFYEHFTILST